MIKERIIDKLETLRYNHTHCSFDDFTDEEDELIKQTIKLLEASPVFICDGYACAECSKGECKHTIDLSHAVNFEDRFNTGKYEEKIK